MTGSPRTAVIFDMDGVIVDSEPVWQRVEIALFARLGVELDEARCRQTMGLRVDEVVAHWRRQLGWAGPTDEEVVEQIMDDMARHLASVEAPMAGVGTALDLCAERGLALALASSSRHRLIDAVLDGLALRSRFAVVCSGEDERWGKPHPDIFLTTARRLGVEPARCVVIEDSVHGVVAAKAAQMACIAVPARENDDERFVLADVVLPSLEALDGGVLAALGA